MLPLGDQHLLLKTKKGVLVDADVSDGGSLTIQRVGSSIRMLGASFFHEMTHGKRNTKLKTYDQTALLAESMEQEDTENFTFAADQIDDDDSWMDALVQEGDEDAALVSDFETAAMDLLQSDEELASAYTAYADARRRLNEKVRSRGFWPIHAKGKHKGATKGVKGKFSKGHNSSRKSLQQRIMESRCRICNKIGHWKAECPNRTDAPGGSNARSPQAPTSFVQGSQMETEASLPDALPMEFLNLPHAEMGTIDDTQPHAVAHVFMNMHDEDPKRKLMNTLKSWHFGDASPKSLLPSQGLLSNHLR